ncbi:MULTISPECIES: DUF7344 domain-containing protein [Halorussus]|uniref:DUF7344 domain-containing protein n=1 Tax=Halorussus TaxID=1070314 RepID=UPI00209D6B7E|nr:hypothetical protein [Halorussus vallis]USZ73936.1 hypothetical protein NGM07_10750 [Halorussus vallis]
MKDEISNGQRGNAGTETTATPREPDLNVPPLSQDNVFDALSSRRSRYVLVHLREEDGAVSLDELADVVAAWETGKAIDLVSEEHRERVFTSLAHSQLPKLSMMGLVKYDEQDLLVDRGPHAEQADAYLDIAVERDDNVER